MATYRATTVAFPSVQVSEKGHRQSGKHQAVYMQGGVMAVMTIKTQNAGTHLHQGLHTGCTLFTISYFFHISARGI